MGNGEPFIAYSLGPGHMRRTQDNLGPGVPHTGHSGATSSYLSSCSMLYSSCLNSPSTRLPGKDQRDRQSPTHSHGREMSSDGSSRSQKRYAVKSPPMASDLKTSTSTQCHLDKCPPDSPSLPTVGGLRGVQGHKSMTPWIAGSQTARRSL